MKVYISADIEGTTGVVHTAQSVGPGSEYERARKWMAQDVNAAIEGALAAGASEIIVNDAHESMRNLIIDDLHPAANLISGYPKPVSMLNGLDATFDTLFFIGYHARTGSRYGIINHTYSGSVVSKLRLNGQVVGEIGPNAALAGHFGVGVSLVTGDTATVQEAKEFLGDVETVAVKEGYGRYVALCIHPAEARQRIREAATRAVERAGDFQPYILKPPIRLEMCFPRTPMADEVELIPHMERIDDVSVAYEAEDMVQAYNLLQAMVTLAASAMPKKS